MQSAARRRSRSADVVGPARWRPKPSEEPMRAFRFAIRTCGHAALGGWRWTAACRGRAPNSFLLMDALCRCLDATDEIAAMAVVVDAKEGAASASIVLSGSSNFSR